MVERRAPVFPFWVLPRAVARLRGVLRGGTCLNRVAGCPFGEPSACNPTGCFRRCPRMVAHPGEWYGFAVSRAPWSGLPNLSGSFRPGRSPGKPLPCAPQKMRHAWKAGPGFGRPVRCCWTVPYAGVGIDALPNYGQFTTRSSPVPGLSTTVKVEPLCWRCAPWPGRRRALPRSSRLTRCNAEPSGTHERGQIEHSPRPSGTKRCWADRTHDVRFKMLGPGVADPMMGEAGVARQARGWLPGVLARSPAVALSGVGAGWWGRRKLDLGLRFARLGSAGPKFGLS